MNSVQKVLNALHSREVAPEVILLTSRDYDLFRAELEPQLRPMFDVKSSQLKFDGVPLVASKSVRFSAVVFADLAVVAIEAAG